VPEAEPPAAHDVLVRLEVGILDRASAEALVLELRRLARRHALEIEDVRFDRVVPDGEGPSP
jgi:hypothetical protein